MEFCISSCFYDRPFVTVLRPPPLMCRTSPVLMSLSLLLRHHPYHVVHTTPVLRCLCAEVLPFHLNGDGTPALLRFVAPPPWAGGRWGEPLA